MKFFLELGWLDVIHLKVNLLFLSHLLCLLLYIRHNIIPYYFPISFVVSQNTLIILYIISTYLSWKEYILDSPILESISCTRTPLFILGCDNSLLVWGWASWGFYVFIIPKIWWVIITHINSHHFILLKHS